jgi:hypothetical protein
MAFPSEQFPLFTCPSNAIVPVIGPIGTASNPCKA